VNAYRAELFAWPITYVQHCDGALLPWVRIGRCSMLFSSRAILPPSHVRGLARELLAPAVLMSWHALPAGHRLPLPAAAPSSRGRPWQRRIVPFLDRGVHHHRVGLRAWMRQVTSNPRVTSIRAVGFEGVPVERPGSRGRRAHRGRQGYPT
jgi:hypothetical protein